MPILEKSNRADGGKYSGESSELPETRPSASSHDPEPTSSKCNKRAPNCKRTTTTTEAKQPIRTEREFHFLV